MSVPTGDFEVEVVSVQPAAEGVVVIELAARGGAELPSWSPGAHIDLVLPTGLVRQYSLSGSPTAASWRIGVLREEGGRGGSRWIADRLKPGVVLGAVGPRNHFVAERGDAGDPASTAPLLLVAGGIGVTPILPMAAAAALAGRDYHVHYSGHDGRMGFVDELAAAHGDRLELHVSETGARLDVAALAAAAAASGAEIVCCGPARLIDAVVAAGAAAGVPVTVERFESGLLSAPLWKGPFEVELALTGVTVEVPPDRSILDVAEEAGALVLSSCHEGTCGTCETPVLEGEVDHRDSILSPSQRARNDTMFVCVSRAACARLVLEL
jgi:ferredoxin-NADP reductase